MAATAAVMAFEVYVLMTMRSRMTMLGKDTDLHIKLAERGIELGDALRTHDRITRRLSAAADDFAVLKDLLAMPEPEATTVVYASVLWPGFRFEATGDDSGFLESAGYRRDGCAPPAAESPCGLDPWSVDVRGFAARFGPLWLRGHWPLADEFLPASAEYEFSWDGQSHTAGFCWGLHLFTARAWE